MRESYWNSGRKNWWKKSVEEMSEKVGEIQIEKYFEWGIKKRVKKEIEKMTESGWKMGKQQQQPISRVSF